MRAMKIPERFTGTIYVLMNSNPTDYCYGSMSFFDSDISEHIDDRILVGKVDVDIPLESKNSLDKQVAQLRKSKQKIIDDATEKANQIDEAIESLLAIEHEVSA